MGTVQSSLQSPEPYIGTEPSVLEIFSLSVHSPSVPVHIDMRIKLTIGVFFANFCPNTKHELSGTPAHVGLLDI